MDKELASHTSRAVVSGLMSRWKAVSSGAPLGLVLGLVLFNIFAGHVDSGIEDSLCKFTDDTEQCGAINTQEGRDGIQGDLDKLERQVCANLMKFKVKCKVLHRGQDNPQVGC